MRYIIAFRTPSWKEQDFGPQDDCYVLIKSNTDNHYTSLYLPSVGNKNDLMTSITGISSRKKLIDCYIPERGFSCWEDNIIKAKITCKKVLNENLYKKTKLKLFSEKDFKL